MKDIINYIRKRKFAKQYTTKELKPKDGYNRFKWVNRIIKYKYGEIKTEENSDFSNYVFGKVECRDNEDKIYEAEFILLNKKWIPFSIREINNRCCFYL